MFVIVQSWTNLENGSEQWWSSEKAIARRMGSALRHSGVAVTITTFTDFFAFGVGVTTVSSPTFSFFVNFKLNSHY